MGRRLFKERVQGSGVRGDDGSIITDPVHMEKALWEERAPLWTSAPELPQEGKALLDRYFRNRGNIDLPRAPSPSLRQLVRLILASLTTLFHQVLEPSRP